MKQTDIEMKITSLAAMMMFNILIMSAAFPGCFSYAKLNFPATAIESVDVNVNGYGSSVVLRALGNIYPLGYYAVNLSMGNPPKLFDFDFDTGSDLTWVQCDAPCTGCTKHPEKRYRPHNNLVRCSDPRCAALHWPKRPHCPHPNAQCDYVIEYADQGISRGFLVSDLFPIKLHNGSMADVLLTFGCGYNQQNRGPHPPPDTAGVLGLGRGGVSVVSQLHARGLIKNVIGHCISGRGDGFLFLGDDIVPRQRLAWTNMLQNPAD